MTDAVFPRVLRVVAPRVVIREVSQPDPSTLAAVAQYTRAANHMERDAWEAHCRGDNDLAALLGSYAGMLRRAATVERKNPKPAGLDR